MTLTRDVRALNAEADAVCALLDGGTVEVLAGNGVVLCVLDFANVAFFPASGGEAKSRTITSRRATGSGRATMFRCLSGGGKEILVGDIGVKGDDVEMVLDRQDIRIGGTVEVSLVYTASNSN